MFGWLRKMSAALICLAALVPADLSVAAPPPASPPAMRAPTVPPPILVLAMVRNTLLAVDQANKTGNYTVLRDMGGPNFSETNDAARLAQIFGPLKVQGVDLLAAAVVDPQYSAPPSVTVKHMLYVAGQFPITPRPVRFELLFEIVRGQWRIYGVSIAPA